jgi:hypothetical protein
MKKLILTIVTLINLFSATAQRDPLEGSGKIVNKNFTFTNFDKVNLMDLDGVAEIEVGKPFSISAAIDDNLEELLSVSKENKTLHIFLKGNRNNRMYIENTNIKIRISVPFLSSVQLDGNNGLTINGIAGYFFKVKCTGNGSVTLNGTVSKLDVVCTGNGNVNARNLIANDISITRRGNGNVYTNKEKVDAITSNDNTYSKTTLVKVILKNNTVSKVSLSVKYPVSGSYGIAVNAKDSITESFPLGTKIYRGNQFTVFKKSLFVIEENSGDKPLIIE